LNTLNVVKKKEKSRENILGMNCFFLKRQKKIKFCQKRFDIKMKKNNILSVYFIMSKKMSKTNKGLDAVQKALVAFFKRNGNEE
jgi:hypothetical protein